MSQANPSSLPGHTLPDVIDLLVGIEPGDEREQLRLAKAVALPGRRPGPRGVQPGEVTTYEDLASDKWKGRICMRDGQHSYNIGLFASMVAHHGADYTEKWLAGLKQNLVKKPAGNDRAQAKAIHAGECDLGLANTYYLGLMKTNEKEPEEKEWAKSVKVLFPNAADRGTHRHRVGSGPARHRLDVRDGGRVRGADQGEPQLVQLRIGRQRRRAASGRRWRRRCRWLAGALKPQ